jgi:hypothetical protein
MQDGESSGILGGITIRQREPAANEANGRADQKRQTEKVDREDSRKRGGVLVNQPLEIHACQLALDGLRLVRC